MSFVDEIEITIEAGKGGSGCVSFHREKFIPKGGPDGGDGGKGGDVYFLADPSLNSLNQFLANSYFKAEDGKPGRSNKQKGKDGKDLIISIPVGTHIIDIESNSLIDELDYPEKKVLIAKGGKGGLGNYHFASASHQTPLYAQPGQLGEKKKILLNLKIIADIGFIGLPNAGKSTLLMSLTNSHPKIADYPFTTLSPNLGILIHSDFITVRRLLLADIPGIIEGASRGSGLGISFLKHIEKVQTIVYILDINSLEPSEDYKVLQMELNQYSSELTKRKSIIVFNKIDLIKFDKELQKFVYSNFIEKVKDFQSNILEIPILFISAKEKFGLDILVNMLLKLISFPSCAEKLNLKKV
ncbi:MAG: GTPase ObgE [Leptonema sp. (in: bacteria)]